MDTLNAIFTRRSIRQYTGEPISEEQLHTLLKAGFSSPSCMNSRSWRFIVVREQETFQAISKIHPYSRMLPQAGCGLLVCVDTSSGVPFEYLVQDASAATQNILLAAHALGLGAVWLGVSPLQERVTGLQKLLDIPDEVKPITLVSVGHPAEERAAPDRYEADKVFFGRWQGK